jgi:hypothetical protein
MDEIWMKFAHGEERMAAIAGSAVHARASNVRRFAKSSSKTASRRATKSLAPNG